MNHKKLTLPLISLLLLYISYSIISAVLEYGKTDFSAVIAFIIAYFLTLSITGVFAFVGFVYPTNKLLPTQYYQVSNPALLKNSYKMLGVKYFRKLLMLFFWGKSKNRKKYFDGTRSSIANLIYQSKQSEFGHLLPFIIICVLSIFLLFNGFNTLVIAMMSINILGNLYPIILQRHHRMRIDRLNS